MSQNSASIRNEAQEPPKIQPQLHTLPFRKRIWGLNRKWVAGMLHSNAKIAYVELSVCDFMIYLHTFIRGLFARFNFLTYICIVQLS